MNTPGQRPSLGRLLGALLYDLVVLSGLVLGILVIVVIVLTALDLPRAELPRAFGFGLWLLLLCASIAYFVISWRRGGQTLGLRAWRLRLTTADGGPVTGKQALKRALLAMVSTAAFGLGFAWVLIDAQRRSWHDLGANTRLLQQPKP